VVSACGWICLCRFGGRAVIAVGVAWFSIASLLLPAALSPDVAAAGLTLPAVLVARVCVVSVDLADACADDATALQPPWSTV
jgi:hypothetical protein